MKNRANIYRVFAERPDGEGILSALMIASSKEEIISALEPAYRVISILIEATEVPVVEGITM